MKPLRHRLLWTAAILMLGVAAIGIAGTLADSFYSIPPEERPQKWLRVSIGLHRVWLSWHLAKPNNTGWAGQTNHFGFRYNRYTGGDGYVAMSAWYLIPPALLIATFCILRARRIAIPAPGLCPQCGYDLRATPDKCPECGCIVYRPVSEIVD
jgi:hypothetical protein